MMLLLIYSTQSQQSFAVGCSILTTLLHSDTSSPSQMIYES